MAYQNMTKFSTRSGLDKSVLMFLKGNHSRFSLDYSHHMDSRQRAGRGPSEQSANHCWGHYNFAAIGIHLENIWPAHKHAVPSYAQVSLHWTRAK